ncbi:MAG: type II toxin-antitoxin system PemK/MazF family toxin [Candidatus Freyrarchaeum guaymaensis]|nr:type II toxin-antitoxin system PemK/MazF family toxin [Candidatus Sigynarchaeota archaeon]
MKGKIVLIPFPFTDLTAAKMRPALVLHEGRKDAIVALISSRVPKAPTITDVVIGQNHPEFKLTGLKVDSIIKLDKVATILKKFVIGEIGEVGKALKKEINNKLEKIFIL